MTWYCNGQEIEYDFYGGSPSCDLWEAIVKLCDGNKAKALERLIDNADRTHYTDNILSAIAECHSNPTRDNALEVQYAVDSFIWETAVLYSDDTMRECEDKTVEVAGFIFEWKDE